MAVPTATQEFDLAVPYTAREIGSMQTVGSGSDSLVVQARALSGRVERRWEITAESDRDLARDRLLSMWASTAFGVLPLLWTPPGETEISVVLEYAEGVDTTRVAPDTHGYVAILAEVI